MNEGGRDVFDIDEEIGRALAKALESVPIGGAVPETPSFRRVLDGLELLVPSLLARLYGLWRSESLDGFWPWRATKADDRELDLYAACWVMSSQMLTPFHARLRCDAEGTEIEWMRCRVGVRSARTHRLLELSGEAELLRWFCNHEEPDALEWMYTVTYGD